MANILNDEEILCSINSYKNVKAPSTIANFFTNLISGGVGGRVINDFKLILTPKNLYIQAIGHAVWGGLSEALYTDQIAREDIQSFEVETQRTKESITITTIDDKKMIFIRDNENKNYLALIMAMFISENKEN